MDLRQLEILQEIAETGSFTACGRKQHVSQDVRDTLAKVADRTRELRGTLRLSGGMTVCLYIFPTLVKQLRRSHPQLDVKMVVATAGRSVEEIRAGHVDAGLLTLPVEEAD